MQLFNITNVNFGTRIRIAKDDEKDTQQKVTQQKKVDFNTTVSDVLETHPSLTSNGLFYSVKSLRNVAVTDDITTKEIPSDIEETEIKNANI